MESYTKPHRRYNPLTDEWVLVSPQRAQRPWQGQQEVISPQKRNIYEQTCYLCPGNKRVGGQINPDYPDTYVCENDSPALLQEPSPPTHFPQETRERRNLMYAEAISGTS